MNMLKYKDTIEEGDLIIVYLDVRHMYPITVTRDSVFQSRYGALKHNDCMGRRFGSSVACTRGWVYVLFPTPELWTMTLPHRTQILYAADISMIVTQLDLRPGAVVCEAGTGSGSLTHALVRAVAPSGRVHTFDFHEQRAEVARKEFREHGFHADLVTVEHRDVGSRGFGVTRAADAVFLDLPNPWDVIPLVTGAFKLMGGRICTFSPCIEQVQRTCIALGESGFSDIVTVECLQRVLDVKRISQPVINLEDDDFSTSNETKGELGNSQKRSSDGNKKPSKKSDQNKEPSKNSDQNKDSDQNMTLSKNSDQNKELSKKSDQNMEPSKNSDQDKILSKSSDQNTTLSKNSDQNTTLSKNSDQNKTLSKNSTRDCDVVSHWAAVPPLQTAGHTGYLTYASYVPPPLS